ncbi:MAG TPA: response regulator transcription factor [Candidatus Baltobacteraceae bacterium]
MIAILIVDDHPIVRDGIVAVLGAQSDMRVIRAVASVDRVEPNPIPDVIVLDWELPGVGGARAVGDLRERFPDARIVIFSAYAGQERVGAALAAGARAYVLKGAPADELTGAIRIVLEDGTYLGRNVNAPLAVQTDRLTPREREVLRLAAEGLTNAQIALHLQLSERTVKFHLSSIFGRLGAQRRTQAIAIARERGLL